MACAILSILSVMVAFPVSSFEFGATLTRHFPHTGSRSGHAHWLPPSRLQSWNTPFGNCPESGEKVTDQTSSRKIPAARYSDIWPYYGPTSSSPTPRSRWFQTLFASEPANYLLAADREGRLAGSSSGRYKIRPSAYLRAADYIGRMRLKSPAYRPRAISRRRGRERRPCLRPAGRAVAPKSRGQ